MEGSLSRIRWISVSSVSSLSLSCCVCVFLFFDCLLSLGIQFSSGFPGLTSLKSVELPPASWMSLACYDQNLQPLLFFFRVRNFLADKQLHTVGVSSQNVYHSCMYVLFFLLIALCCKQLLSTCARTQFHSSEIFFSAFHFVLCDDLSHSILLNSDILSTTFPTSNVKDLSACFLTYQTISSSFQGTLLLQVRH
jgi:hypothetical protein